MSAERMDEQLARLTRASEGVFGEPAEVDAAEAEELLQAAGIDPARIKANLYARFQEKYSEAGTPLPPRVRQALEDLRPGANAGGEGSVLARAAKLHVDRLLAEIKNLPNLLKMGGTPAFTAAYRNRTELSAHDKKVLDKIADELGGRRMNETPGWPNPSSRSEQKGERQGPIFARALLKELSVKHGSIDDIAAVLGLKLSEVEADGFDGALIRARNAPLGAIAVRASIRETGRKNFTKAHEIAHFVLPGHEQTSVACTASEVANWTDVQTGKEFERDANEFAAELLMPSESVEMITRGSSPSLEVIEKMAREFGVSLSAAAWRYCDVVAEQCAVIWSTEGTIQWAKRSASFPFYLPKGWQVEEGSFAAACFQDERVPGHPRVVPLHLWTNSANLDSSIRLLEQSKALPAYRSVISLLWIDPRR